MAKLTKKQGVSEPDFLPNTRRVAALAADHKAYDLRAYDVRTVTIMADSFVVCSAKSEPQAKAILNGVKEGMKEIGVRALHTEGRPDSAWMVLDYGDIILHIFREEARAYYDLDGLWGDAPVIDLELDE